MLRDFIAIDFETANQEPSSVCSVGVVMVRDGQIVDSFYSLIQPEPNYYNYWCQQVHGISQSDTVAAACGYDLQNHHYALANAEACAAIALYLL